MPAFLDMPTVGASFDPEHFPIRGWVWLEERHAQLAAVEAWSGDHVLGRTTELQPRPDVNTTLDFPEDTRTGFDFIGSHSALQPGELLKLEIRARFLDGNETTLLSILLTIPPSRFSPLTTMRAQLPATALGLEVGAHALPVDGLSPFYTDTVAEYVGSAGRADFLADAGALPLPDNTLDYLCSSHVLEHLPDPLAALHEWHRVLRPGGWLYLVVPDKRYTFDAPRAVTSTNHLLEDFFHARTAAESLEHVDEFVRDADWSRLVSPGSPDEIPQIKAAARERYRNSIAAGEPVDFHFHTFTPDSLATLLRAAGFIADRGVSARFELVASAERFPPGRADGVAVLLRKTAAASSSDRPVATYCLEHARAGIPSLPLVCPVTLAPLRRESDDPGSHLQSASPGDFSYVIRQGKPVLLPAANRRPIRPWSEPDWRDREHAAALNRLSIATVGQAVFDDPAPDAVVDPLGYLVRGWVWLGAGQPSIAAVEVWRDDIKLGATTNLYLRDDVVRALQLAAGTRTGFEIFAHDPDARPGNQRELQLRVRFTDGHCGPPLASRRVNTIPRDYRTNHFGVLLDRQYIQVQRRANVFARGQASTEPNPELALWLRRYLGPPPRSVVECGCGVAPYGRGLLADGYDWTGTEADEASCAQLKQLGLPHVSVSGIVLPFPDARFDAALSLDHLNKVEDPVRVLQEIQRVSPRQLIVSVPNCELLGYLWDYRSAPWFMLDLDQTNYFTRWSLTALLEQYYARVEVRFHSLFPLRTTEGTPLYYHLLAVATT